MWYNRMGWLLSQTWVWGQGTWTPAVDIYETADSVILSAELPGVDRDDINIEVEGNLIFLKGERRLKRDLGEQSCHRMERSYGPFLRVFTLPEGVDTARIQTRFKDGLLNILLPKAKNQAIKIEIEGG
mgnify:CR=1 FL=1